MTALTLAIWALVIVLALLGVGILFQLDQIETIMRLMDVACPST